MPRTKVKSEVTGGVWTIEVEVGSKVDSARKEIDDVQRSIDELSLKQGGTSSQMRADLTTMLNDLQSQISRLHSDINETQHRLNELGQKLDRLDQRKFIISGGAVVPGDSSSAAASAAPSPGAPAVKVVDGLDLANLFNQAREDYIQGKYDLAYKGFKTVYEKDDAGSYREQSLYWMGECLWKSGRADAALDIYQRTLTEFPQGDKTCAARFKIGLIFDQKKNSAKRNEAWNQLLDACPQSNEADRARELMKP